VLFDRFESSAGGPRQVATILAHVMVHEIAHLLEGVARHSQTGVMKAHWDGYDLMQMAVTPLPFDPEDMVGAGRLGEVCKAGGARLGRDVAIKVSGSRFSVG